MAINLTTASGTSTASNVSPGREYIASVSGTWSSATVAVQWLGPDGTTWVPFEDSSFVDIGLTKDGGFLFIPPSGRVRFSWSGGGAGTDLNADIIPVRGSTV